MKIYLIFILIILFTVGLNTICQKFLKQQWILWLCCEVPALCMILFMWAVSEPSVLFSDFNVGYYPAGRLIIQNPSALYDVADMETMPGFVNIPIIAILFTPFSLLSLPHAHVLLAILSGLAIFTLYFYLVKLAKVFRGERIELFGLFVINGPLYNSLQEGNTTLFVLLLLVAGFFCVQAKREIWLGILLAFAALIKIPLFLLGAYFAVRGRWRVIAAFSVTLIVVVGASLLSFGLDLHLTWYQQCIQLYSGKPMAAFNVQSVDGFLARLLTEGNLTNWQPIEVGWKFKIVRYALLSILAGTTIWICWRSKPPKTLEVENLEFCIVLCLALVISPISWTHYYLYLLLPFALYLGNRLAVPQGRLWSSLMVASIFLTSLPVIVAGPTNSVLRLLYSKLLISHYFLGGVLLLGVLLAARWHTSKHSGLSQGNTIGLRDSMTERAIT